MGSCFVDRKRSSASELELSARRCRFPDGFSKDIPWLVFWTTSWTYSKHSLPDIEIAAREILAEELAPEVGQTRIVAILGNVTAVGNTIKDCLSQGKNPSIR